MSGSNEQRENIQRLAKGVKMKGGLGPVGTREPIRGKVTPFSDNTFAPPSTAPAGYREPACTPEGEDPDDKKEPQEPIDPEDPNTFVRGRPDPDGKPETDVGVADVGAAIDGTAGPKMPLTGGGTSGTGGLRELTGLKDCETGKEFNLHLDGNFVPPEGWDDPDTPPIPIVEVPDGCPPMPEGKIYEAISGPGSPFYFSTLAELVDIASAGNPYELIYCVGQDPVEWQGCSGVSTVRRICGNGNPNGTYDWSIQRVDTPPEYSGNKWPEDGVYDIAIKDGQFQTSEFDADQPDDFEQRGTLDFCYGDGGTGRAEVTADGGVVYYGTDGNGAPTGTARVLDSGGQLVAAGDATDSFISQYLPQ